MTLPRSDHFNGKTFFQSHHAQTRLRNLLRWRLTRKPKAWPAQVPFAAPPAPPVPQSGEIVATWIGHATFLLQSEQGNVLIDPVFAERASPVPWAGPARVHPPGLSLRDLPRIDAVLLSHDHYDHCDLASLGALAEAHRPLFIAPLRHRDLLAEAGAGRIAELDWWESVPVAAREIGRGNTIAVTLTPTKHWSNRFGTPRNHRLWGGFGLSFAGKRVWFVGDTGYDAEIFRQVRERLGSPQLALVPIGAYEPRWFMEPMHMNPAEAVRLHEDVGAHRSIAMHWGTFPLADEGWEDPLHALEAARTSAGIPPDAFRNVAPGESVIV